MRFSGKGIVVIIYVFSLGIKCIGPLSAYHCPISHQENWNLILGSLFPLLTYLRSVIMITCGPDPTIHRAYGLTLVRLVCLKVFPNHYKLIVFGRISYFLDAGLKLNLTLKGKPNAGKHLSF